MFQISNTHFAAKCQRKKLQTQLTFPVNDLYIQLIDVTILFSQSYVLSSIIHETQIITVSFTKEQIVTIIITFSAEANLIQSNDYLKQCQYIIYINMYFGFMYAIAVKSLLFDVFIALAVIQISELREIQMCCKNVTSFLAYAYIGWHDTCKKCQCFKCPTFTLTLGYKPF